MAKIEIYIANETGVWQVFKNEYKSYSIDQRYDFISDSFSMVLVDNDLDIKCGYWMHYVVNGKIEFRGLIDTISRQRKKTGRTITINGKSKTTLLVEEFYNGPAKDYNTENNSKAPYKIIQDLIAKSAFLVKPKTTTEPYVDPNMDATEIADLNAAIDSDLAKQLYDRVGTVVYTDEFKAAPAINVKITPGSTVWQNISKIVAETKFEVLYQNDVLYFGDLKKLRQTETDFNIRCDPDYTDVLDATLKRSIGARYSSINLFGEAEYNFTTGADTYTSKSATVTDSTLLHKKFMCSQSSGDLLSKAIKLREDQRYSGEQISYTVQDHFSGEGLIWAVNRYCNIQDTYFDLNAKYVIYGRTLMFSSVAGTTTKLLLSIERSNVKDL